MKICNYDFCNPLVPKVDSSHMLCDLETTVRSLKSSAKNTQSNEWLFKCWVFAEYTGHLIHAPKG
jgi:hypothetical protein